MKKSIIGLVIINSFLFSNSNLLYEYGIKTYNNSATKKDGISQNINFMYNINKHYIDISYLNDRVNREHFISKLELPKLNVDKYSFKYKYKFNDKISFKTNYIKIIDNLAPSDQGKIYGIGMKYSFTNSLFSSMAIYKSDYKQFDVDQYDIGISKGFKISDVNFKLTAITKIIKIDGNQYGNYSFKDNDYLTTNLRLGAKYNNYNLGLGAFFGERVFTILDDGTKVQHHAMEQDKTYMISFSRRFKKINLFTKYSFQNGKELQASKDDVDTKNISFGMKYKF